MSARRTPRQDTSPATAAARSAGAFAHVLSTPCRRHHAEMGEGCWPTIDTVNGPSRALCGDRIARAR